MKLVILLLAFGLALVAIGIMLLAFVVKSMLREFDRVLKSFHNEE